MSAVVAVAAVGIGSPLIVSMIFPAASSAGAAIVPYDAVGCSGILPTDQIENCVTVVGTASDLQELGGTAFTHSGTAYGHEEITGPSVPGGYMNSTNQTITTANNGPLVSWNPNHSVTAGNYCATFWKKVGSNYTAVGPDCEYVS